MKASLNSIKKNKQKKKTSWDLHNAVLCEWCTLSERPQDSFIISSISEGRLPPHESQAWHLSPKQIDGPFATLLSQLQHDLSPNLGNWIIFLSEVLATIITIPGNCSFLEITCHRKLCFSFQHIFPNFISLHGGEEAYVASQQHSLQTTENCRVIEATGAMDTHHPEISFCVTGSAKNATNLHYNMLFLSIINPLPLPSTLQNNIRTLKYPQPISHPSPIPFLLPPKEQRDWSTILSGLSNNIY